MSTTDARPPADLGQPAETPAQRALWLRVLGELERARTREGWALLWAADLAQYATTPGDRAHGLERLTRRIEAVLERYPWGWLVIEERDERAERDEPSATPR